jgi:protein phosphatase
MSDVLRHGAATDIGRSRKANEDAILVQPPLFAVADGMGGHLAGDVASQTAVETLAHEIADAQSSLAAAVKEANRRVFDRAQSSSELSGMGTTMTAVLASGSRVEIAHVGDSRAYLYRKGRLSRLTRDHTLLERMVRQGKLRPEDARNHPQRSVLERALGVEADVRIDVQTLDIRPGDRLLLCSDGLTTMLEEARIVQILGREEDPSAACDRLVAAALEAGGHDNVSVIVVDYPAVDEAGNPVTLDSAPPSDTVVADEHPPIAEAPSWSGRPEDEGPSGPLPRPAWSGPPPPPAFGGTPSPPAWGGRPGPTAPTPPARVSEPAPVEPPDGNGEPGGRWVVRRALVAVAVVAVLVAGVAMARSALLNSWYVGDYNGEVAIYRGVPGSVAGIRINKLEARTGVLLESLVEIERDRVRAGKTAGSLKEAQDIVRGLRRAPVPAPAPSPTEAPAGTPNPAEPSPQPSPGATP